MIERVTVVKDNPLSVLFSLQNYRLIDSHLLVVKGTWDDLLVNLRSVVSESSTNWVSLTSRWNSLPATILLSIVLVHLYSLDLPFGERSDRSSWTKLVLLLIRLRSSDISTNRVAIIDNTWQDNIILRASSCNPLCLGSLLVADSPIEQVTDPFTATHSILVLLQDYHLVSLLNVG